MPRLEIESSMIKIVKSQDDTRVCSRRNRKLLIAVVIQRIPCWWIVDWRPNKKVEGKPQKYDVGIISF